MNQNIRVQFAKGSVGKTIVARLLPGTDLISGIEEICRANDIKHASIINCFGSFQKAGYVYLVEKPDSKIRAGYGDIIRKDGPIEFLNGTGIVCQRHAEFETHIHGTMCDQEGVVFGGHLIKGENNVLTVDLILKELKDMEVLRRFDIETGGHQLYPIESGMTEPIFLEIKSQ